MDMALKKLKEEHERAFVFMNRIKGMDYCVNLIERELTSIVASGDFEKLPKDAQEGICVPMAKSIRYWKMQRDRYVDEYTADMTNRANKIDNELMNISLEEAKEMAIGDLSFMPLVSAIEIEGVEVTPEEAEPQEKKEQTDEDILRGLADKQIA